MKLPIAFTLSALPSLLLLVGVSRHILQNNNNNEESATVTLRRRLTFFDPKSTEDKQEEEKPAPLFSKTGSSQYLGPKETVVAKSSSKQQPNPQDQQEQQNPTAAPDRKQPEALTQEVEQKKEQKSIEKPVEQQQGSQVEQQQGPKVDATSDSQKTEASPPLKQRKGDEPQQQSEPLHQRKGDVPVQPEQSSKGSSGTRPPVDPNEPPYVQLCRELVHRTQNRDDIETSFLVQESPSVCTSPDTYASLTRIMLSATIAQAGSKARLRYQHGCDSSASTVPGEPSLTIQQFLPPDLTLGTGVGQFPLAESCTKCLDRLAASAKKYDEFVECMGIPPQGEPKENIDPMTFSLRVASFRHNVQQAVLSFRRLEITSGVEAPVYGGAVILLDLEQTASTITTKEEDLSGTAVAQAWALPQHYYQDIIPQSISSIAILVTQNCIDATPRCKKHGQLLAQGLSAAYPHATMHGEILTSSSMMYSRILDAPLLICPPTVTCLLPSMLSEFSKASHHVTRNMLFEWFKYVARENRKLMSKSLTVVDENDIKKMPVATTSEERLTEFLAREKPQPTARRRRLSSMLLNDPRSVVDKRLLTLAPGMGVHENTEDTIDTKQALAGYTLDPNIPSFVHLCRELLDRKQHMGLATQYVVHESPVVCNSPDSFQALSTIMVSSVIAHAGSLFRLTYDHNCVAAKDLDISKTMIQQLLPETLTISMRIGIDHAVQKCSACAMDPNRSYRDMMTCFEFPVPGPMNTNDERATEAAKYIPHFRHNIDKAVNKARLLEAGNRPPTNAGVVIYLGTDTETGKDVYQVPFRHYAKLIPRDVSSISILVSDLCTMCGDLSSLTKRYLHTMYPTASVDVEIVSGTAIAYARVMEAPMNICSPSLFCVLPSLYKEYSHTSHLIAHSGMHPWFPYLANTIGGKLNKSIFYHYDQPTKAVGVLDEEMRSFLFVPRDPASHDCIELRGRLGQWVQDFDYARAAEYVTPLKRFQNFDFTPTPEMPFRLATSYRWDDAMCPVQPMTKEGLCSAMQSLGLTRIYIVGDSLGMQMAQSLWKLLGNEDDPYVLTPKTRAVRFHWSRDIACPNTKGFEIVYTRNDLVDDNDDTDLHLHIGDRDFNCGYAEFCMPWVRSFSDYNRGGTLLIANVGTHVHDLDLYRKYLTDFFALVDKYKQPKDLVMFRTTVPGHENCQDPSVSPLKSYDEYLQKHYIADFKSYHMFPTYNRMAEEKVRERHSENLRILDVVPMTILRPDGHTSSPQRCSTCKDNDCLHYMLPGPTDWWNHLMYSNLVNLGAAAK